MAVKKLFLICSIETAAVFFKRRSGKSNPHDLLWFADNAPNKPPIRGDERG
jgi:hypothetical protein